MAPRAHTRGRIDGATYKFSAEHQVNKLRRVAQTSVVLAILLATGCVIEPRESYYDRDHHRYYHDHSWHDCGEHDDHCR